MSIDLGDYKDVPARLRDFREKHPEGSLQPADMSKPLDIVTLDGRTYVVYIAAAYRTPDDPRPGIAMAWEPVPGRTPYTRDSEVQNAETSAWGRAIVAALASEAKYVASREDVERRRAEGAPVDDEQAKYLADLLNAIPDEDERRRTKVDFANAFGRPAELTVPQLPHALRWLERRGVKPAGDTGSSTAPQHPSPAPSQEQSPPAPETSEVGDAPRAPASDNLRGEEAEEAERLHRPEPVEAKAAIAMARAALPQGESS